MTVRSWSRTEYGAAVQVGGPPTNAVAYTQNGLNTPRSLREKGIYPDNPYNMVKQMTTHRASSQQYVAPGSPTRTCNTAWFGTSASVGNPIVPDRSKAFSKLLEKWRSSDFNAGVAVGEGRESLEMVINRLRSIASAAQQLRRRNFGGALASLAHVSKEDRRHAFRSMNSGFFANAWLELQYGWRPLINDIYAAAEFVKTKPRRGIIRTSVKETNDTVTAGFGYPVNDAITIVNERRLHLKVVVTELPSTFERLGLTDPLSVAWELVPFSFVIDWFAPIGDAIQAIHAIRAMPVSQYCETNVRQYKVHLPVHAGQVYYNQYCRKSSHSTIEYINVSRQVSSTMPSAWGIVGNAIIRSFTDPGDLDLGKALNSAALVRSKLGKLGQYL